MRKLTALIAPAFVVLLLAAACGGGDEETPTPTPDVEETAPAGDIGVTPVETPEPTPGETPEPTPEPEETEPAAEPPPAGGLIAYVDSTTQEIFIIPAGGGLLRKLREGRASEPAWSPDGEQIAYVDFSSSPRRIFVIDADGSGPPVPIIGIPDQASGPTWSPDGKIAYVDPSGRGIWVIDVDGSVEPQQLTTTGSAPAWSPDGDQIAFVDSTTQEIFIIPAGGGTLKKLTEGRGSEPAWSQDGEQIAYVDTSSSQRRIFVIDADGSGPPVPVIGIPDRATAPTWSPDGKQIAYVDASGRGIWVIDVEGGEPQQITTTGTAPAWSPQ